MLVKDDSSTSTLEVKFLKQKIESKHLETVYLQEKIAQKNQEIANLQQEINTKKPFFYGLKQTIQKLINPQSANAKVNLPRTQQAIKYPEIVLIKASELFDSIWYLTQYPDAMLSELEPAQHYLQFGAKQGYNPGPNFSTNDYLFLYPDVQPMNPLVHYEAFGKAEGRACQIENATSNSGFFLLEKKIKMIFISGEPETPGHTYRIARYASAAKAIGADIRELTVASAYENVAEIYGANILIIWRAVWDDQLSSLFSAARKAKIPVIYDIDDLLIDPNLAKIEIVDGIRTTKSNESAAERFFASLQTSMKQADYCSAPTHFLADYMRSFGKKAFLLPNGFDENTWQASRLALRTRSTKPSDGLIRIGYAGGSRTHQKDFAKIADVIARLLRQRPNCRLVLFRKGTLPCTDIDEFPELLTVRQQVEWREMVPLKELPFEMARFDINIAPLEAGNAFCEAKSELKFFESALVEVPVVASPTLTFCEAIEDGKTGFLAHDENSWYNILSKLLDDASLRKRIGRSAYYSVLWKYGSEHRKELMSSMLDIIFYPGSRAARAFELHLLKSKHTTHAIPVIPAHEIIVCHDKLLNTSEVTIVVPNCHSSHSLIDRLDSVKEQTLLNIDLVIVDDCSTDNSIEVASQWINEYKNRFNRILLIKNNVTSGLGLTKNVGFSNAETLFVLTLNPDNILLENFATRCLAKIKETNAAFVYPNLLEADGNKQVTESYNPILFTNNNFVGGTTLIRFAAWAQVGGYHQFDQGADDYDFWCKFVEHGLFGHHIDETLIKKQINNKEFQFNETADRSKATKLKNGADIYSRHPWILCDVLRE